MDLLKKQALLFVFPVLFAGTGVWLARYLPQAPLPVEDPSGVQAPPLAAPPPMTRPVPAVAFRELSRPVAVPERERPAPAEGSPRVSREEARRLLLQQYQARLERHVQTPGDATWSRSARDALGSDFAVLTQGQRFTVRDIDCRSQSCVTTLEWPSYAEATQGYEVLLHHAFGMDCARGILLPEPEDPAARYQAKLLLDCANLRP